MGVGHRIVDRAIDQALNITACATSVSEKMIKSPIFVFQVRDRLTTEDVHVKKAILGVSVVPGASQSFSVLKDWELLVILNDISEGKGVRFAKEAVPSIEAGNIRTVLPEALKVANIAVSSMDVPFKLPDVELLAIICPAT